MDTIWSCLWGGVYCGEKSETSLIFTSYKYDWFLKICITHTPSLYVKWDNFIRICLDISFLPFSVGILYPFNLFCLGFKFLSQAFFFLTYFKYFFLFATFDLFMTSNSTYTGLSFLCVSSAFTTDFYLSSFSLCFVSFPHACKPCW